MDTQKMENQNKATLPQTWVTEATKTDQSKTQPWVKVFDAGADDPHFDQTADLLQLYQDGLKTCHAEGSLAA